MSELYDPPQEPAAVVADTGVFVACGRQQNNKYVALERFARRNDLTLLIPDGDGRCPEAYRERLEPS